ncbi:MAG: restriction endonuclease subunit S [Lachnospiraceae bacterium]|nr:restriction endonuclease subunit S [Lachnospiraceae bacterium]
MDKKEMNNRVWDFFNAIRGREDITKVLPAALAVDRVKKKGLNDYREIYEALREESSRLGAHSLFNREDTAIHIYMDIPDELDWAFLLQRLSEAAGKAMDLSILPEPLIRVMEGGFNSDPETVLIVEGEKFVLRLAEMIESHPGTHFTISSQREIYVEILRTITENYRNVSVVESNVYESNYLNERFDMILSSPAFGGRTLSEDPTFICRELEMVALENLLTHLNSDGDLIIVLPGRITFAQGKIGTLRSFIQSTYTLKEIDALPTGVFANTAIQTYLINIQNARPTGDDVIIRKYGAGERKTKRSVIEELVLEDDTFAMLDELEEMGSWSVDRIFEQQSEEWQAFNGSATRKEVLGNVAEIFRGKNITKKVPNGKIGVINISNIGEYVLNNDNLDYIDEEERKVQSYLLKEGDVLLPGRGTAIRVAVFHEDDFLFPCITSSNVIVIRPDEKVLKSLYLKIFLDSPIGGKVISQAQQGTVVMNLSYKDLNDIEVPLPTMEEQQEITLKYEYELRHFQETVAQAERRWREVLNELEQF